MEIGADLAAKENTNQHNNSRRSGNFPPSLWGCSFASFSFPKTSRNSSHTTTVEELKENVKDMLIKSKEDPVENIEFINLLCRLLCSKSSNTMESLRNNIRCESMLSLYEASFLSVMEQI
uniref:Uncharacterized protein n=1 Tax=Salix viminalis TaxID=40686 RepID=A0A6N2KG90_SALVM